ncbi:molybdopterin-synthase adenylyltransferase MoeB [uncultured Litoreibacter sp.]|uniref:HesA/MoeB/ThiF family protein n=1 Tax=uncultured Litoreibacter sp. TaxID=1392394 RepID=UPI0026300766|nr:molybdopterin-synthase adenylyltransferase MoeB [uncultured Litoreibacter sp.]
MVLVLALAGVAILIGRRMGVRGQYLWGAALAFLALVLLLQLFLPDAHPVKEATGTLSGWLIFIGVGGVGLAYLCALRVLKRHAQSEEPASAPSDKFTDAELNRYARHIVLREIGGQGQKKMKKARVLVIGAGGLGAPVLQYLAAAGVGTIGVIDEDVVDSSNLQRQVIHTDARIGMPKVFSAQAALQAQNPLITVLPYNRRLEADMAADLFADYDLVLDGSDNAQTRYLVNRVAVKLGKPLISGAITQWEGQLSLFHPASGSPCYACIFPHEAAAGLAPSCAEVGVVGALPGVIGSMMAVEAIKLIAEAGAPLKGQMLIYDALYSETRLINLKRDPQCSVCGQPAK